MFSQRATPHISVRASLKGFIAPIPVLICLSVAQAQTLSLINPTEPTPGDFSPAEREIPSPRSAANRGYLGITLTEICPEVRAQTMLKPGEGLMIGRVAPDSPAATFGLKQYDILTKFNDQWIVSPMQFITLVENAGPRAEVEFTVLRRGTVTKIKATLGPPPATPPPTHLPPLPEEMLTSVIRLLRDNPVELETVHRFLHTARGGLTNLPNTYHQGSRVTLHDEAGKVEITSIDTQRHVRAWDTSDTLIFTGPCNTAAEHAAIPPALRPRVERLLAECQAKPAHRPAAPPEDRSANKASPVQ